MPATRSGWRRAAGWPPNSRASGRSRRRRIGSCSTWRGPRSGHCEAGAGGRSRQPEAPCGSRRSPRATPAARARTELDRCSVGPPGPGPSGVGASAAAESTPPLSPRSAVGLKRHRRVLRYSPAMEEAFSLQAMGRSIPAARSVPCVVGGTIRRDARRDRQRSATARAAVLDGRILASVLQRYLRELAERVVATPRSGGRVAGNEACVVPRPTRSTWNRCSLILQRSRSISGSPRA